jgi:flagellar protein FlaJ
MAFINSFRFWQRHGSKVSFKDVSGFDLFYQLIYLSAIASAGISRSQIFQLGSALPRVTAAYFLKIHLLCQRLGYEYSRSCTLVGEAAKSESMKTFLLRFSDALAAGQPESDFLDKEAEVQGESYEKEYERDLASLTKWTDAYAAIAVSSALIVIINLVSALIYDLGMNMTIGLMITAVLTAGGGAWVISRAAQEDVKATFSTDGPRLQRLARRMLFICGPAALFAAALLVVLGAGLGITLLAAALILLPPGLTSVFAVREIDKMDREVGSFLRSLGGMATSTGTTVAESLSRMDLSSFPHLKPHLEQLRWRLNAAIDPQLCWQRFTSETGSNLVRDTIEIFNDAVRLGGDSSVVADLASRLTVTTIALRAKREVVSSTFSWMTMLMHGVIATLMVIILEVIARFSAMIAESAAAVGQDAAVQSMSLPLPSFSTPQTELLRVMTTGMVVLLAGVNTLAIAASDGGHKIKAVFFFSLLLAMSGASFILVPPLIAGIMQG